jgi:hypothetical protein
LFSFHIFTSRLLSQRDSFSGVTFPNARAVWKFRGLLLLLRVGTLWRCGSSLFFEVPPLASDVLLTTLHPLLENVLQTVCRKLQEDSGTGGFDLSRSFLRLYSAPTTLRWR